MAKEIERKFKVANDAWRPAPRSVHCRQGIIASRPGLAVRVRVMDGKGTLNIKKSLTPAVREEFEFPIPLDEAEEILSRLCEGHIVEKTRHYVDYEGLTWEIDVFEDLNEGLIIAEIELETENQEVPLPPWAGDEVTDDPRYFNANLAQRPYRQW